MYIHIHTHTHARVRWIEERERAHKTKLDKTKITFLIQTLCRCAGVCKYIVRYGNIILRSTTPSLICFSLPPIPSSYICLYFVDLRFLLRYSSIRQQYLAFFLLTPPPTPSASSLFTFVSHLFNSSLSSTANAVPFCYAQCTDNNFYSI